MICLKYMFFLMLEIVDGINGGLMRTVVDLLIEGEKENHLKALLH